MATPTCAYDCIFQITYENPCAEQIKCLCMSSSYIQGWQNCLNQCDAADQAIWNQYAESQCAAQGVQVQLSTTQATGTGVALTTSVIYQTSFLTSVTGTQTVFGFLPISTSGSSASTAGAQPVTSTAQTSAPAASDSTNGLGVGAIIGIAIGAVAIVLLAILVAFLLWRRRRKQPTAVPPEVKTVQAVKANSWRPDTEKEVKPAAATSVVHTSELSAEQAGYASTYENLPNVPETLGDLRFPSQQLNPMQPNSIQQVSPSTVHTEITAVVPSEIVSSTRSPSEYGPPYHGIVEADSMRQSYTTPPISELEHTSYRDPHELSASPYMGAHQPLMGHRVPTAQEPGSLPSATPADTYSIDHTSSAVAGMASRSNDGGDVDLERMKAEIEAVRAEKERVLHLQALEERERELSRKIVDKELSRGPGN